MEPTQILHAERGTLPQEVIDAIAGANALIVLRTNEHGQLVMNATVMEGAYLPETNVAHAFVAQVYAEYPNLTAGLHNQTTDAMRYRAMRDFAMLANSDAARFEVVNAMLQNFEETSGFTDASTRTVAASDAIADFLCFALAETEPAGPVA